MKDTTNEPKEEGTLLIFQKAPITIIGVTLVGITGAALYDFLVKPGLNSISKFIFNLVTLGSQRIKDSSFNSAALDPTSVPSLALVIALAFGIICSLLMLFVVPYIIERRRKKMLENPPSRAKLNFTKWFIIPMLITIEAALIFIPLNIMNQSILTWRVFNANLAILDQVIDDKRHREFKAKFSSMKTEQDYQKIVAEMSLIASKNTINLRDESPW